MTIDPLLVDCYELDGRKDWESLASAGVPWVGAVIKATQGLYYRPQWFDQQIRALSTVCPSRNGSTWFFGAYHYLDIGMDGAEQADYFLGAFGRAGVSLTAPGMLWPMVDVERGGQRVPLTKTRVEDVTGKFAARVLAVTGRTPTLYGGELLASLGITNHLGCGRLAIARYAATLPHDVVMRIGWGAPWIWQFCGDGEAYLPGYPSVAPGCGKVDISVLTGAGGLEQLAADLAAP